MCILFINVNPNAEQDQYKIVLACNRDELYDRKTLPAHRWLDNPNCLGGIDMKVGREGGTWLAMNEKSAKIGVILSIACERKSDKQGRGSIITDYMNSKEDPRSYINSLREEADKYSLFNFISLSKIDSDPVLTYFTNNGPDEAPKILSSTGIYGFSNSVLEMPFLKVERGAQDLESLLKKYPTRKDESKLLADILDLLKSPERHYPDPHLRRQIGDFAEQYIKNLSSRFVHIPSGNYGTRTHTIILVTGDNQGSYHEWTLEDSSYNVLTANWKYSKFDISFDPSVKIL